MSKLKRPSNVKKKLWRKASKAERRFIVRHEYLYKLWRDTPTTIVPAAFMPIENLCGYLRIDE